MVKTLNQYQDVREFLDGTKVKRSVRCVHSEKIKSLTRIGRLLQGNRVKTEEKFMVFGAG